MPTSSLDTVLDVLDHCETSVTELILALLTNPSRDQRGYCVPTTGHGYGYARVWVRVGK